MRRPAAKPPVPIVATLAPALPAVSPGHLLRVLAAAAWLLPPVPACAYEVEIEAPKPLAGILKEYLDISRYKDRTDLSPEQFQYMVETVGDQVRQFASTEGYFDPVTSVKVEGDAGPPPPSAGAEAPSQAEQPLEGKAEQAPGTSQTPETPQSDDKAKRKDHRVVHITVDPGARTVIRNVDVSVAGTAVTRSPEQVEDVKRKWGLPPGEPFRQEDWDKAKEDALITLQSRNYYSAKLADTQARIEPDEHAADLRARYDSGPAYVLGPIDISGTKRYPERIVRNVNPLREGESYRVERLLELQRAIQNQPYYANVQVDLKAPPDPAKAAVDGVVTAPVSVKVREYPPHRLTSGVGFTTDTGAQVEGRYSYYNLWNRAWVLDSQLRIEQKRQYGFLEMAMPPDSATFRNSVYTSYERTIDIENTDTESWRAGLKRSRSRENYDTTFSLDFYYDNLTPEGQPSQISKALVPAFAWTRRNVDNLVFPRRGNVINTQIGVAGKGLLSDATFLRLYGRIRQYVPVGKRDLFIARLELGGDLTGDSSAKIPASLRFRAGGTDSVRGYSYQSIGTQSGNAVLPAKYLATGGLEYQYWFQPDWGAALFWDVGTAADNLHDVKLFHGVGVGARWRSPVGRVQLDVGYGIQAHQFRPHISLGVAF